jgi:tRNA modification GTPase
VAVKGSAQFSSYFSSDTIVAIATSLAGDGGVGVIRLSGPAALEITQKTCTGFENPQPRFLHRIEVIDEDTSSVIDDGLAVLFPQGQSFTGELVVELQLHGGRFLLQTILQRLLRTGKCRMALAGEFSFRALRNGKMSLGEASGLGQLIGAKSLFEVKAARRSLSRDRNQEFKDLAERIRALLAQSELSIDFVDQDVEVISANKAEFEVKSLLAEIEKLLIRLKAARRLAQGVTVAIVGEPNAGKSTLFNALLAEDRAIVSPEAGTTRDVITEHISLGPYYVRLADTAGVRDATGKIEHEGVQRARELAAEADLAILALDATLSGEELTKTLKGFGEFKTISVIVLNKSDCLSKEGLAERQIAVADFFKGSFEGQVISLSAAKSQGLEKLLDGVKTELDRRFGLGLESFLPTEFQLQMLLDCEDSLKQVLDLLRTTKLAQPELISAALSSAARALSDLVGETTPDTVLAKIFSEFCIGK